MNKITSNFIINMKIIKLLVILFISINNSNCFIHYFVNKYNGFKGLKEIKILNDIDNIKYCSKLSSNVYRDKANITDNKYNTRIKIVTLFLLYFILYFNL